MALLDTMPLSDYIHNTSQPWVLYCFSKIVNAYLNLNMIELIKMLFYEGKVIKQPSFC